MSNASRDQNDVPTLLAVEQTDGATIVPIVVNASNHGLKVTDDTTGTDQGPYQAERDENFVPTLLAVSSQTTTVNGVSFIQGVTPVVVYADLDGNLLVDSN